MRRIGIGTITGAKNMERKTLQRKNLPPEVSVTPLPQLPESLSAPHEQQEGQLAVDIYQTDTEFVVTAPVAGVARENITIRVSDDVLTIYGTRVPPEEIAAHAYLTHECFWGPFSRSIVLPETVDTTKIDANFKNGILSVRIPKIERIRTRIITIRS